MRSAYHGANLDARERVPVTPGKEARHQTGLGGLLRFNSEEALLFFLTDL